MLNIMMVGHNDRLMIDTHNYLSRYFKVQSFGFDWNGILEYLSSKKVDLIFVCLKEANLKELRGLNLIRNNPMFQAIKFVALGFAFEVNAIKEVFFQEDKIMVYPIQDEQLLQEVCELCEIENPRKEQQTDSVLSSDVQKHVLVIDDDARMLRAVKSWLEGVFTVSVVNNGKAGIGFLQTNHPDLVVLDYQMPDMSGVQTLQKIRSIPAIKDIPVVFLTSVSDREKIKQVVSLNPCGYILKGVTREEMIMKLNEIFLSLEQKEK